MNFCKTIEASPCRTIASGVRHQEHFQPPALLCCGTSLAPRAVAMASDPSKPTGRSDQLFMPLCTHRWVCPGEWAEEAHNQWQAPPSHPLEEMEKPNGSHRHLQRGTETNGEPRREGKRPRSRITDEKHVQRN